MPFMSCLVLRGGAAPFVSLLEICWYYLGGMGHLGRFWWWNPRVFGDFLGKQAGWEYSTFVFGEIRGICGKYSYVFRRGRVSLIPMVVSLYLKWRPIVSYVPKCIFLFRNPWPSAAYRLIWEKERGWEGTKVLMQIALFG